MRINIPYITTSLERDIIITLYLAPLWWVLGLSIVIYHIIALWLLTKMIVSSIVDRSRVAIPKKVVFLLLLIIIYGISIVINAHASQGQRVIASPYNYSFWIMGLILIVVVYNSFTLSSVAYVARAFRFNIIFIGLLAIVSLLLWFAGYNRLIFASPVQRLFPFITSIPNLRGGTTVGLITSNWFLFHSTPIYPPRIRIMALPDFPALGGILLLMMPLVIIYFRKNYYYWPVVMLGTLSLLLTFSRAAILALLISVLFVYVVNKKHRMVITFFAIGIFIFSMPLLEMFSDWVIRSREGSTAHRLMIYEYSIKTVMKNNPIIGIGIKPREMEVSVAPIGSQSTYISLLLKTGVMGLASFIAFQFTLLMSWYRRVSDQMSGEIRNIWSSLGISLLGSALFISTQDMDALVIFCFIYFILAGIMMMLLRKSMDSA